MHNYYQCLYNSTRRPPVLFLEGKLQPIEKISAGSSRFLYPPILKDDKLYRVRRDGYLNISTTIGENIEQESIKICDATFITSRGLIGTECFIILQDDNRTLYIYNYIQHQLEVVAPNMPELDIRHAGIANDILFSRGYEDEKRYCFALDLTNGAIIWKTELTFLSTGYLLVANERIILQNGKKGFNAYTITDGMLVWKYELSVFGVYINDILDELPYQIINVPQYYGTQIIFSVLGGFVISLDSITGEEKWINSESLKHSQSFLVGDNGVSCVISSSRILKIDVHGNTLSNNQIIMPSTLELDGMWSMPIQIGSNIVLSDILSRYLVSIQADGSVHVLGQANAGIPKENIAIYIGGALLFIDEEDNIYRSLII